jgi:hypothetical protein
VTTSPNVQFRFSGHETFPCRYAWLPKAVKHVAAESNLFADESRAMVKLGVGKNMVRAIRFWAEVTEVIQHNDNGGWQVTRFGGQILGHEGYDPFLESLQTLWLLHWKISARSRDPLFAWHFLLNYWHRTEFSRTEILRVLSDEARRIGKKISDVTVDQHFSTFLHTYVPTRSAKREVVEDNLDCPLVELNLINQVGERAVPETGRREPVYSFRVAEKAEISPQLFAYCVNDFWLQRRAYEKTLTFRDIAIAEGSPGQIFKLPERDVRDRLERLKSDSDGAFDFQESAALQQIVKLSEPKSDNLLDNLYGSLITV